VGPNNSVTELLLLFFLTLYADLKYGVLPSVFISSL